jgi:hypothetical protein
VTIGEIETRKQSPTTRQEWIRCYLAKGWQPVPVPLREKNPGFDGWPQFRGTAEDPRFKGDGNLSLLLGIASHNLHDADLDAPEALAVADVFLDPTAMVSGRKSKPRSHRFIISSEPIHSKKFEDPLLQGKKDGKATLVELRGMASTGSPQHTVVPPSLHQGTGELICWEGPLLEPAVVDARKLQTDLAHLAACALIVRYWRLKVSPHGHDLAMALAGGMLRSGLKVDAAKRILFTAARQVGYELPASVIEDTARNLAANRAVTGWPRVGELLDPKIAKRLREWIGGQEQTLSEPSPAAPKNLDKPELHFPQQAMIGSLGAFAQVMAKGTEVPEEFYFAAAMTMWGNAHSTRLRVNAHVDPEPRLYTVLLGESADAKKTTAVRRTAAFFHDFWTDPPEFNFGVGSAEGLAKILEERPCTVICYDELRAFLEKTKVTASVLLPMVTSLFETTVWHNRTKKEAIELNDAHLSLVAGCTLATYERMWTPEALAIGFMNRLLVVVADRKPSVPWPNPPEPSELTALRQWLADQEKSLPPAPNVLCFEINPDALARWDSWYRALPRDSIYTKRLDTIGFRLMSILTHTCDKQIVDLPVIEAVLLILDYEFRVRKLTDPIDAENVIAKLEMKIINVLQSSGGGLWDRNLKRACHASRYGNWCFERAVDSLIKAGDLARKFLTQSSGRKAFFYFLQENPPG